MCNVLLFGLYLIMQKGWLKHSRNKKLLGAKGIASSNKCLTSSNKKLLVNVILIALWCCLPVSSVTQDDGPRL